jgi:hypothetical protein
MGIALALVGTTVAVLTVAFVRPEAYHLRYSESFIPLVAFARAATCEAVVLAAGGAALVLGGGRWRLLASGVVAGSAAYPSLVADLPGDRSPLPAWLTHVVSSLPVLLVPLAVLLAMTVQPRGKRGGAFAAAAAAAVVGALDWAGNSVTVGLFALYMQVLAPPMLLVAAILACTACADRPTRAWWSYVVLGLPMLVSAVACQCGLIMVANSGAMDPDLYLNAGPIIGVGLAAIALWSPRSPATLVS